MKLIEYIVFVCNKKRQYNSVMEYHQYATELGVGQPPSNLKIIVTNRHYGNGGAFGGFGVGFTALLQGIDWPNNGGLNAYLNAVENFNPRLNNPNRDPWQWIPQGLPYDLFDDRNDAAFAPRLPVDNVTGYTAQQCFNALQSDVRTIPAFRNRLLQQNAFSQQSQVNALFNAYNY